MIMNSSTPWRKTLLALAIGTVAHSASAESQTQQTSEDTIVVQATDSGFTPGGDALVPAYLDGQVAHGGRLGMLGEQKAMDVPFNVIGYTAKSVQDQQAKTLADVVSNDAGVQAVQGFGNFAETYRIRGFKLDGDDMTMGGLPGIVPRQVVDTQMLERVEVFKGANGLLNGAAGSGVGGMINLEPKHAEDTPLTRVGVDYSSQSQIGGSLDLGRRFGDDNQFGARVNLLHREGDAAVDDDHRRTTVASVGLDYRGERVRTSLDVGYQKKTFHGGNMGIKISKVDFIPDLPDASHNYSQQWGYSDIENEFGMARAEVDITDAWTAYTAFGAQHSHEVGLYTTADMINKDGDAWMGRLDTNRIIDAFSGMAGVRGDFDTGVVSHKVNVGYSAVTKKDKTAWRSTAEANRPLSNIYDTPTLDRPDYNTVGGNYFDPLTTARNRTQGWLLSDTLGVLDDSVLFTVAARHQKVVVRNYSNATGAETVTARYTESRWMPTYGIVYKPWESLSLYANHTEALQPGSNAPKDAANAFESVGIMHSKQNEVGVKVDYGRVGGTLALFEIKKPSAFMDATTKRYGLDGEQRNRGVELNVFGEPVLGLRLNGSTTWLDPEMTKTKDGINDGNDAIGVSKFYMALGAEYDIKPVDGLTATARVNHTGSQYANAANTKKLDSYTTLDLGMRYRMRLNQAQNEMVWRVGVDNVTDEKYWSGVEDLGTYVFVGEPRTLKVSMSYDF
ncbi:TonB-dependent siderophore receptor [Enterobacter sp.]|uniref:TonB-dependent receptor n=1 Tax=Enterobacter sp. TaxID=42895 RepID=UPI00296E7B6E|nr:TonB-dependent siderophore receptor [Enterobacter sp.]